MRDDELEHLKEREERRRAWKDEAAGSHSSGRTDYSSGRRSGPGASGGKNRNHKPGKKKSPLMAVIIALEVLVIIGLVVGAGAYYIYHQTMDTMQKVEFNEAEVENVNLSQEQVEKMEGYMNVLCFGVDSRMAGGKQNVGKGTNADVNLIVSANLGTGEIRMVSVFRDTYLNISDKNSYNKINAAYAYGGPEQAVKAINKNLGLNITQYATFNWKAVADGINLLGGVDIDLSQNEFSWINAYITETVEETGVGSHHLKNWGENIHMDGIQAVAYARLRLGDTDYARTERQRIVLEKCFEKAKKADFKLLHQIFLTVLPQIATNLDVSDVLPMLQIVGDFHIGDTMGFPSARGEMDIGKVGDCVVPQTLGYNVQLLHQFLFDEENYEIPQNVREYSNHIASVTGLTKNAQVIDHVPVNKSANASVWQSYLRKQAAAKAAAAAETAENQVEVSESTEENGPLSIFETDENGNYIGLADGNGNVILETDENGALIDPPEDYEIETDADGNFIYRPTAASAEEAGPGGGTRSPSQGTTDGPVIIPYDPSAESPDQTEVNTGDGPVTGPGAETGNYEYTKPDGSTEGNTGMVMPGGSTTRTTEAVTPGGSTTRTTEAVTPGGSATRTTEAVTPGGGSSGSSSSGDDSQGPQVTAEAPAQTTAAAPTSDAPTAAASTSAPAAATAVEGPGPVSAPSAEPAAPSGAIYPGSQTETEAAASGPGA